MGSARQIDLDGRVALVTGGARGIGFAIAKRLQEAGARLAVAARTQADLDRAADRLAAGGAILARRCDVSVPAEVTDLVAAVTEYFGCLDVLVCSHGIYPGTRSFLEITLESYDRVMSINVRSVLLCAQGRGPRNACRR
jgi:NAD(P)-dependent dehydrogenase (short-subunit alcohol dehydrogenase family)